jgi:hypothetical protein
VVLEVEHEGRSYRGRGVSTDIVVASAQAFLEVMNRACAVRVRPQVQELEVTCGAV